MEIVIEAPKFVLWLLLGIGVVGVSSILLKKGRPVVRIISLVFVVGVIGAVLFFFYRPMRLAVTDEALVDNTYMRTITVPWSDVRRAFVVKGFEATEWRPTNKTNGSGLPNLKTGWFRLQGGRTARVLIQTSPDALVLETADTLFVLAPDRLPELVQWVGAHVAIEGGAEVAP